MIRFLRSSESDARAPTHTLQDSTTLSVSPASPLGAIQCFNPVALDGFYRAPPPLVLPHGRAACGVPLPNPGISQLPLSERWLLAGRSSSPFISPYVVPCCGRGVPLQSSHKMAAWWCRRICQATSAMLMASHSVRCEPHLACKASDARSTCPCPCPCPRRGGPCPWRCGRGREGGPTSRMRKRAPTPCARSSSAEGGQGGAASPQLTRCRTRRV